MGGSGINLESTLFFQVYNDVSKHWDFPLKFSPSKSVNTQCLSLSQIFPLWGYRQSNAQDTTHPNTKCIKRCINSMSQFHTEFTKNLTTQISPSNLTCKSYINPELPWLTSSQKALATMVVEMPAQKPTTLLGSNQQEQRLLW